MNAWAHPTHHARRQLDRCTHFHTTTQQSHHWLQWDAANSSHKLPLPLRRSPPKSNTPTPSPTSLTTPNGIRVQSAILPKYRCVDRQTWDNTVNHISALLSYSDSERCAKNIQSSWLKKLLSDVIQDASTKLLTTLIPCAYATNATSMGLSEALRTLLMLRQWASVRLPWGWHHKLLAHLPPQYPYNRFSNQTGLVYSVLILFLHFFRKKKQLK